MAGCCLCLLAGCQQGTKRSLVASYIVPPDVVSDVSSLQNMAIVSPVVKLTGNYARNRDRLVPVFTNCLNQRLSAGIYKERFFNVQDDIHGNRKGLQSLDATFAQSHGYSIKPARIISRASIKTWANIALTKTTGKDTIVTPLASVPYVITYSDKGVPHSSPNYDAKVVQKHVSHVPFTHITAKGDLLVRVYDTVGKQVYEKRFTDLKYDTKLGGDRQADALPTVLEIASSLFDPSIKRVVRDISPHKVERELFANEKGDETAVVLLKATAFSEAYKRLSDVTEKNQKEYNDKATKIKNDFAAQIKDIKASGKAQEEIELAVKALQDELRIILLDTGRFRSPDYENMAIACETMGITDESLEFYELAASADPDNTSAGVSLARIKSLADKALKCPGTAKNTYEEEENKER
ncbi:MAG: hypothetical protein WC177_06625 [Bacilli bacterium]